MKSVWSRRDFIENVGAIALIVAANRNFAFAQPHGAEAAEWAKDIRLISDRLLNKHITPAQWQYKVSKVYEKINLSDVLRDLDFDAVRAGMDVTRPGGHWNQVFLNGLSNKNNKTKIITKIVGIEKGRAVPPHGHENEVSAFLTLSGKFRTRLWDRAAVNKDSLDIIPAFDSSSVAGQWSSQSEEKTNVHWLTTKSKESFFLSIRLAKIDGTKSGRERILIDPDEAQEIHKGVFRAPILDKKTWWKKYSRV